MKPRIAKLAGLWFVVLATVALADAARSAPPDAPSDRAALRKQFEAGNFRDAYIGLSRLALDPNDDPALVGEDLGMAIDALVRLGGTDELDDLIEPAVRVHAKNWRLLWAAANDYLRIEHRGFIIAGKFWRGTGHQDGEAASAQERDRVRALQLMTSALPLVAADPNHAQAANFYFDLASAVLAGRGFEQAWRLQSLTDLGQLPDYDLGWYSPEPPAGAWQSMPTVGQVYFTARQEVRRRERRRPALGGGRSLPPRRRPTA